MTAQCDIEDSNCTKVIVVPESIDQADKMVLYNHKSESV